MTMDFVQKIKEKHTKIFYANGIEKNKLEDEFNEMKLLCDHKWYDDSSAIKNGKCTICYFHN